MSTTSRTSEARRLLRYFEHGHLPPALAEVVEPFQSLAHDAVTGHDPNPELDEGIRKLLEAKDCLVRCRVDELRPAPHANTPEPFLLNDDEIQP